MTSRMYGLMIALLALGSFSAFAQDEKLLADADAVLNSEQITIDGTFKQKVIEKSPEEILEEARRASEIRQIKKIAKKIEKMSLPPKQVTRITKKESARLVSRIDTIFNDGEEPAQEDNVAVKQAAPIPTPIVTPIVIARPEKESVKEVRPFSQIKVIPYYGVQNIFGDQIDFSSKFNAGVTVESMMTERLSVGIGFNYATLDITDVAGDYGAYYGDRKLGYEHFTLEANSKLFLAVGNVVRPYVGIGLSYNRTNLKFTDTTYVADASVYQEEKFNSSYIAGHARLGSEFHFAKNVGLNVEFAYSHGLSNGLTSRSYESTVGQQKLDLLGEMIEDSDFLTLTAGLIVVF